MKDVRHIVIHHSASPLSTTAEDIRRWHVRDRGWREIGYHGVIEADGTFVPGRPLHEFGAHARPHNRRSLGICVVGDNTKLDARWTQAQKVTLHRLAWALLQLYPDAELVGHRDLDGAATECPGIDIRAELRL